MWSLLLLLCNRRTLQKQEEAREAALKAFHDNIAKRAAMAGATVVAENKARQEREERLMAASEAKARADAEVCCLMPSCTKYQVDLQVVSTI